MSYCTVSREGGGVGGRETKPHINLHLYTKYKLVWYIRFTSIFIVSLFMFCIVSREGKGKMGEGVLKHIWSQTCMLSINLYDNSEAIKHIFICDILFSLQYLLQVYLCFCIVSREGEEKRGIEAHINPDLYICLIFA